LQVVLIIALVLVLEPESHLAVGLSRVT
jgi:hypothetical protein